jgi:23S rRNA (adenine2030-N6)-methyltransferase
VNYRHAFHAGNHADVLKHIVLGRLIEHLKKKDKGFLFLDAHAGIGVYDLQGIEAFKTAEWQGGIGKLAEPFATGVEALIAPYRQVIAALNDGGGIKYYPGSPELAARLTRSQDRLSFNELHPEDHAAAARRYSSDRRVKVTALDAEVAIKSQLPPNERRGLILIDPPYEMKDEGRRAVAMLEQGLRRFAGGIYALWYPIKADRTDEQILRDVKALGVAPALRVELRVREAHDAGGLAGSGLVIINTPWKIDEELRKIVPALAQRLGMGKWGQATVKWLLPPA